MKYRPLIEILDEIEKCHFECEGGPLENNVLWHELLSKAANEGCQDWDPVKGICGECAWCKRYRPWG